MTKERPILFSSPMVKALLDGKKTQTRRTLKPQPIAVKWDDDPRPHFDWNNRKGSHWFAWERPNGRMEFDPSVVNVCPYGALGDTLWVRETWAQNTISGDPFVFYRTDSDAVGPWRPSIFMPRWASRLTLRITEVRVERVQDISEDDARAEGVRLPERTVTLYNGIYAAAYAALWDSINAKRGYGWNANPWVWVLSFEVLP